MEKKAKKEQTLHLCHNSEHVETQTADVLCCKWLLYCSADLGYGTILTMGWGFVPCRALAVLSHLGGWAVAPSEDDRIALS